MQSTPPIHAVLFDYGLVLTGPADPTAWSHMRLLTGHDEPTLHAAYWTPRHAYDSGHLTGREYWARIANLENHSDPLVDQLIAADTDLWTKA